MRYVMVVEVAVVVAAVVVLLMVEKTHGITLCLKKLRSSHV